MTDHSGANSSPATPTTPPTNFTPLATQLLSLHLFCVIAERESARGWTLKFLLFRDAMQSNRSQFYDLQL